MKTKRGFTLIELLVVIAIIGILSSVVLASLNTARAKGRDARRISDLQQIRTALELYYNDYRTYPVIGWSSHCTSNGHQSMAMFEAALQPYLSPIPFDPAEDCGAYRQYIMQSNGQDYKVMAHNAEAISASNRALWDPDRDGGPISPTGALGTCTGSGTPWAYAVYTPGAECW